jgi:short-subunit dehydrogenase
MRRYGKGYPGRRVDREERTVVITGAASGIGKAAVVEFARERFNIVAVARSEKGLDELVPECDLLGATVLAQVADVADQVGMNTVAANAVDRFGSIDVWVNNAGVLMRGRFGEVPHEVFRKVIETNLFGCVHGSRAVLPYFREQGRGVLINIASFAGLMGLPNSTAYSASKAAIGVFSQALRMELEGEPGISVCTVYPASVDTPLFQHGANYTGRELRPIEPVYQAGQVAEQIVRLAYRPRREVIVGASGKMGYLMHLLMPGLTEKAVARMARRKGPGRKEAPVTDGNLYQPDDSLTTISGGWTEGRFRAGPGSKAALGALGWVFRRLSHRPV